MKNESQAILMPLSKKEITALCTQVSETALTAKQAKKFTAADLCYIHKTEKQVLLKQLHFNNTRCSWHKTKVISIRDFVRRTKFWCAFFF